MLKKRCPKWRELQENQAKKRLHVARQQSVLQRKQSDPQPLKKQLVQEQLTSASDPQPLRKQLLPEKETAAKRQSAVPPSAKQLDPPLPRQSVPVQQRKHGQLAAATLPREAVQQSVVLASANPPSASQQLDAKLAEPRPSQEAVVLPKQSVPVQQRKDGQHASATLVAEAHAELPSAELLDAELPSADHPRCLE